MTFDLQPLRARETEYLVVSLAVFAGGQGAVAGFVPALETCSFLEPIEDGARTNRLRCRALLLFRLRH